MYALAKTKPRVWLKLSRIDQKLVLFSQNPLEYVKNFAISSVYFRPIETPISDEAGISPKPPMSADTELEISVYHYFSGRQTT